MENNLTIKEYSEKSIAVYGQTKSHKDALRNMGGKFNPHLKEGAGWVFSKSKADVVKAYIASKYGTAYIQPTPNDGVVNNATPQVAVNVASKVQKGSTKKNTKIVVEGWLNGEVIMPNSKVEKYVKQTIKARDAAFPDHPHGEKKEGGKLKFTFVQL